MSKTTGAIKFVFWFAVSIGLVLLLMVVIQLRADGFVVLLRSQDRWVRRPFSLFQKCNQGKPGDVADRQI